MLDILNRIDSYVWGLPLIILLLGVGFYLTVILRGLQFTLLLKALNLALVKRKEREGAGDISHFQALMTALSATVGTGNIAGVATAIAVGGPGAVFWMWVTGLVGMATKFAEALVAVKYRYRDEKGDMVGGPMVYIAAIGANPFWKFLAKVFAVFACVASFGIGNMVQSNSVADALNSAFGAPKLATGIVLAILTAVVILGGIKRIGRAASAIVPLMIISYCAVSLYILALTVGKIPGAFAMIFENAFTPTAASGGFAGASVWIGLRMGVARGIFSNESGLGSSPIAAAAAKTSEPVSQALVSMTQTFIDTLIVCTMTALVIICSGVWDSGLNGASLTTKAFSTALNSGYGGIIVSLSLVFFAYSSLLGWSYYGERALESLVGIKGSTPYKVLFCVLIVVGAVSKLDVVWLFSDIANALMAFPNLIGLLALSPVIVAETKRYLEKQ
ncbi:Sodium/glycine symporter GlyP [hydrothermal vent metagenome]|uniref:Sodium/glycine symporter GlyP n=1 Tax=hydrothermal vent metagenome TaxID=652676 RepID=A0A3B1CJF7_9ZZZZ